MQNSNYSGRGSVLSRFKKTGGGGGGLMDIHRQEVVLEKNRNFVEGVTSMNNTTPERDYLDEQEIIDHVWFDANAAEAVVDDY